MFGQESFSLKGVVFDKNTHKELPYATLRISKYNIETISDSLGHYSILVPKDSFEISVSYLGYLDIKKKLFVSQSINLDFHLDTISYTLPEVTIVDTLFRREITIDHISFEKISVDQAKSLPNLMGEVDLLKIIQLKPGIQSGSEGNSGLNVRGGGSDQNLILLDNSTIYNPSHLFGLFSVLNSDIVKDVSLYKGDFPAKFGGRLSSVVNINLKDGDFNKYKISGGLGVLMSRLTLEGPIKKGKTSFIVSFRRTYFNLITDQINKIEKNNLNYSPIPNYYFYDLNYKITHLISDRSKISFFGYIGRDRFFYKSDGYNFNYGWGNSLSSFKWKYRINSKVFSTLTCSLTNYKYKLQNILGTLETSLGSGITDYTLQEDIEHSLSQKHSFKYGINYTFHNFIINRFKNVSDNFSNEVDSKIAVSEFGGYFSDNIKPGKRWDFLLGLRVSGFYNKNMFIGLEPRLSAKYNVNENIFIKSSYNRVFQYLQLVSNSGVSLPTDLWYPSGKTVKPQRSDQVATGINILLNKGKILLSNEVYFKSMKNQVDFRNGAQLFNANLTNEFVFGKGWAYGNEIYLEKTTGKLKGWVGYTLSWTWRKFAEINDGEKFHPRYDRRHDFTIVAMYDCSPRLTISANWIYGSGYATTLPVGYYYFYDNIGKPNTIIPIYEKRNNYRMAPYHRMDVAAVWKFKRTDSNLTISIYNVYNRRNPYFLYFTTVDPQGRTLGKFELKQVSLFPILPSITYNFKF